MLGGFAVPNDKDHGIGLPGQHHAVGDGKQRRRIHDHVRVQAAALVQQAPHRIGAEHLGWEGRNGAAGQYVQGGQVGQGLNGLAQRQASGEHGGKADLSVQAEAVVHSGPAEVGINQQHAHALLGQHGSQIQRSCRFAFGGRGAGQQDVLWLATGDGKEQ